MMPKYRVFRNTTQICFSGYQDAEFEWWFVSWSAYNDIIPHIRGRK